MTCVNNAEKTLSNFKEFLKTDKYKEWNDAQEKQRSEEVKQMIGETPDGVPYKRPNEGEAGGEEEEQEQEEKESAD